MFFLIFGSKKLQGLFDNFLPEPCGHKNYLFDKKIFLPNLFLYNLKSHKILDL